MTLSISDSITEASFGIQVCAIRLSVESRQLHMKGKEMLREFGVAIDVAETMAEEDWFYTDRNFLVCGRGRLGVEAIPAVILIDDKFNRTWLLKNKGKSFVRNVDGFPACLYIDRKKIQRCVLGVSEKPKIY